MKPIILLILLFAGVACHRNRNDINVDLGNDSLAVCYNKGFLKKVSEADQIGKLFQLKKSINLETKDESLIGEIEEIIYIPEKNRIIVFDKSVAKMVFVFDTSGKYLHRIGVHGKAGGEYLAPKAIAYNDGKVAIYDMGFKLMLFDLDGSFIKEVKFNSEKWRFSIDKLFLWNNKIYGYTINRDFCLGQDGKKHRVFILTDDFNLSSSVGEFEETYDFGDGDITLFNNRITYSGIFNGKIYQIGASENSENVFFSFGSLANLENLKYGDNHLQYIFSHFDEIDSIVDMMEIKNLLFVRRHNKISVITNNGILVNNDIAFNRLELPKNYEGYAARRGILFYNCGIIVATIDKSKIRLSTVPNPTLLFYEIK